MRRFIYLFIIATLVFSCDKLELLEHSNPLDVSGAGEPLVITEGHSTITSTSVILFGQIEDIGNALVTQHGHCWSISSSPTLNDSKTSLGAIGVASFTSSVLDLTQNTSYYYRAYATNSFGTVYGSVMSFSTSNGEPTVVGDPTVVTLGSSNINAFSVTLEGDITSIGEAPITGHGHCWALNSGPTLSDDKVLLGSGTLGSFTSNVSNLNSNTTYYYRAYATNSFGTVYGTTNTFTTQAPPPPSDPCYITGINSSNTPYDLTLIPSSSTFNFGDNITVNMYHPVYSAGQSSILLYENEVQVMNLCSYCIFNSAGSGNYQRTITLPSGGAIPASNCYTIRVLGTSGNDPYLNISNPITIY
jgi:hypothetical protein